MEENRRVILILSGGMDSTTLLGWLIAQGYEVRTLSVNYGQRHVKELDTARVVARHYGVDHTQVGIGRATWILGGSALTDRSVKVPHGNYDEESMKSTVVPNRNMILLSLAIGYAISTKSAKVVYGAHAGDHTIYPDCRQEFVNAMRTAASLCDWEQVSIWGPFINMSKADIVTEAVQLQVPLSLTWSCYEGGDTHCGQCGTCVERIEAFLLAGYQDPTVYHGNGASTIHRIAEREGISLFQLQKGPF